MLFNVDDGWVGRAMRVRVVNRLEFLAAFGHGSHCVDLASGIHLKSSLGVRSHVGHRKTPFQALSIAGYEPADFRTG